MLTVAGIINAFGVTVFFYPVNHFQAAKLREIVHETDPHAYITITEVADVFKKEKID